MKLRNKISLIIAILAVTIIFTQFSMALSNESIQAKNAVDVAKQDLVEMQLRNISITRANESYQEALQLYTAQLALEEKNRKANYELVLQYSSDVDNIKKIAIKADDELKVFNSAYLEASQQYNLSEIQSNYDNIQRSFKEERFEDTIKLIDEGYTTLSETEASQTAFNSFLAATSTNIKTFFIANWLKILLSIIAALIIIIVFWKTIIKIKIRLKIANLNLQKKTLNNLTKKLQTDYFKLGKISESEYKVKSERFREMTRDIDRQVPLLKEAMVKIDKKAIIKEAAEDKPKSRRKRK